MPEKICWQIEDSHVKMVEAFNRRKLLDTYAGNQLKKLIDSIEYKRCLDIGCGTGEVGTLCHDYTGFDYPETIKNVSLKCFPKQNYTNSLISDPTNLLLLESFDLVIMSAFIDVQKEPIKVLSKILKGCQKYVILHRQELIKTPTEIQVNPSYGAETYHSMININDFKNCIKEFEIIKKVTLKYPDWEDGGHSYLLKKN